MKFLLYGPRLEARSIKQKFQHEVWNSTVKAEQTRLLSCLLYGFKKGKARKIGRTSGEFKHLHCLHFPSQFHQDNKIEKKSSLELMVKEEIRVLFNFLLF